jgi:hypothetical protein
MNKLNTVMELMFVADALNDTKLFEVYIEGCKKFSDFKKIKNVVTNEIPELNENEVNQYTRNINNFNIFKIAFESYITEFIKVNNLSITYEYFYNNFENNIDINSMIEAGLFFDLGDLHFITATLPFLFNKLMNDADLDVYDFEKANQYKNYLLED